jgi:excisionase family DNA binding protein
MARRPPRAADLSDLISQAEAARIRGVSRAAITDLIRRGRLRFVTVAGRKLVFRSQVETYERGAAGRPKKRE